MGGISMAITTSAQLVTSSSSGVPGNGMSFAFFLHGTNKILIQSYSTNLVDGDTNGYSDLFIKDLSTGAITRVSTTSAGAQAIGGDAAFINITTDYGKLMFSSAATNLASGAVTGHSGIYAKNLTTGTVVEIDATAAGVQSNGTDDWGYFLNDTTKALLITNGSNLASGDSNGGDDIFIKNISTGALTAISSSSAGVIGNQSSDFLINTTDETKFFFSSTASNLVAGDSNSVSDIFMKNVSTGVTTVVSSSSAGVVSSGPSAFFALSQDEGKVWFQSLGSNLVSGDTNSGVDVFIKNLSTGALTLVSSTSGGAFGNGGSNLVQISGDETKALLSTTSSNFSGADTNTTNDLYIKNISTGALTLVSATQAGVVGNAASSINYTYIYTTANADLSKVIFYSAATNFAASDTNSMDDLFLKNVTSGALTLISGTAAGVVGNAFSELNEVSADFNKVVFTSAASNLASGDTNGAKDVFLKDVTTGALTLVSSSSAGAAGNGVSEFLAWSVDGSKVLFTSTSSNLVSGDTNGAIDLFVKNLSTGVTTRISNTPNFVTGDTGYYDGSLFVDNDTKVIIQYAGANSGGNSVLGVSQIGIANLTTGVTNMVASGTSGVNGSNSYTQNYGVTDISDDGSKFMLFVLDQANTFTGGNFTTTTNDGNSYIIPLTAVALPVALNGDGGDNVLTGTSGADIISGLGGNDTLYGQDGNDILNGNGGNDTVVGGFGDDTLYGEDGNDTLFGEYGNDTLIGGFGDDVLYGQDDNDTLFGEGGNDRLIAGFGDDVVYGQDGNDTLYGEGGHDRLIAGFGDDQLFGQDGNDTLFGEGGNDLIQGGIGNDTLYGQDGLDVLFGEAGDDLLFGGIGDDRLYGQDGNDTLQGEAGDDILDGGAGFDFLVGGAGVDQLTGGAGGDNFFFSSKLEPADFVYDFNRGEGDKLVFQASGFNVPAGFGLTQGLGFQQGAGVTPTAATASFYFDTNSKALWFDADGTGPEGAHVIAFLLNTPTLAASDFVFV
jgi:hypothetical protein